MTLGVPGGVPNVFCTMDLELPVLESGRISLSGNRVL